MASGAKGREFESRRARHKFQALAEHKLQGPFLFFPHRPHRIFLSAPVKFRRIRCKEFFAWSASAFFGCLFVSPLRAGTSAQAFSV